MEGWVFDLAIKMPTNHNGMSMVSPLLWLLFQLPANSRPRQVVIILLLVGFLLSMWVIWIKFMSCTFGPIGYYGDLVSEPVDERVSVAQITR